MKIILDAKTSDGQIVVHIEMSYEAFTKYMIMLLKKPVTESESIKL
jgi:hypothetical protein